MLSRIEELRRICCTEAERARQLRIDELSMEKEESKSTVYELLAQFSGLPGQGEFFERRKRFFFYDPETASSSGTSHVPSQPMSLASPPRNNQPRFLLAA